MAATADELVTETEVRHVRTTEEGLREEKVKKGCLGSLTCTFFTDSDF